MDDDAVICLSPPVNREEPLLPPFAPVQIRSSQECLFFEQEITEETEVASGLVLVELAISNRKNKHFQRGECDPLGNARRLVLWSQDSPQANHPRRDRSINGKAHTRFRVDMVASSPGC